MGKTEILKNTVRNKKSLLTIFFYTEFNNTQFMQKQHFVLFQRGYHILVHT